MAKAKITLHGSSIEKEPEEKLLTINRIFFEVNISLNSYYAINWNPNLTSDIELPPYLKFLGYLNYKNFVIEICKLVHRSSSEQYNLFDLLDELKNSVVFAINPEIVNGFLNSLSGMENDYILDLRKARNKVYAHTDTDHKSIKMKMGHSKTQPIIDLLKEIIVYLNKSLKINPSYHFNSDHGFKVNEFYDQVITKVVS